MERRERDIGLKVRWGVAERGCVVCRRGERGGEARCGMLGSWGVASWHVVHGFAKYWRVKSCRRVTLGMAGTWLSGLVSLIASAKRAGGFLGRKYDEFHGVLFRRVGVW